MSSRKTITIVTSPPTATRSLPPSLNACASPTTKQAPLYRIEERSRTIYVASDVDPSQWDTHSLNAIFTLAEAPETDSPKELPIRRTQSSVDTQVIITEDTPERSDDSKNTSPRFSVYRSRRPGVKSSGPVPGLRMSTMTPSHTPQNLPRRRILFYHKHDPHYGFTNFSAHPVIYNGKKYPTSEHLFQSFKVDLSLSFSSSPQFADFPLVPRLPPRPCRAYKNLFGTTKCCLLRSA